MPSIKFNKTQILCLVWSLILLSFCTVHLTGDFECFLSWARQTHNSSATGISSLSETWELKGILLRSIFLMLYNISSLFANDVTLEFQYIFKFLGAVMLNIIIAASVYLLPNKYITDGLNKKSLFFIVGIMMFSVHFASHLQAEFIAVPFLILATCLDLRDSLTCKLLAGLLVGLTFFLKSPIPIMGGSLMMTSMMLKKNSLKKEFFNIIPLGISMCVTIACIIALLKVYSPQEITDMLDASSYQHTLLSEAQNFKDLIIHAYQFCSAFLNNFWYNPAVLISALIIFATLVDKEFKKATVYIGAFIFPMVYIIISNCYFVYHYYLFVYVSIFIVLLEYGRICSFFKNKKLITSLLMLTVIVSLLVNPFAYKLTLSPKILVISLILAVIIAIVKKTRRIAWICLTCLSLLTFIINGSSLSASSIRGSRAYNKIIQDVRYGKNLGKEPILFLDGGSASFYITNKSFIRYFYPLPIQRIDEQTSPFIKKQTFIQTKNKILSYHNKYILLADKWFFANKHDDIRKLINNYIKLKTINCPSWSWDLFCYSQLKNCDIDIYKRSN